MCPFQDLNIQSLKHSCNISCILTVANHFIIELRIVAPVKFRVCNLFNI